MCGGSSGESGRDKPGLGAAEERVEDPAGLAPRGGHMTDLGWRFRWTLSGNADLVSGLDACDLHSPVRPNGGNCQT